MRQVPLQFAEHPVTADPAVLAECYNVAKELASRS